MMYPYTAINVKESDNLKIKDILKITKNYGVKNLFLIY